MKKEATTKNTTKNATTQNAKKEGRNKTMKNNTTTMEAIAEKAIKTMEAEKVTTLRKWAKARNIEGYNTMKKAELVAILAKGNVEAATKAAKATTKKEGKATTKTTTKKERIKKQTKAKAEIMTTLKAERNRIAIAIDAQNTQNVEIADALNRIKTMKLYEEAKADSMKDYINNKCGGKLYGMTYSTINLYINAMNYVYSLKNEDNTTIFAIYGMHLIQALVTPCRYYSKEVIKAVKDCRIRPTMSLASLKEIIKAEEWTSPRAQKEGKEGNTAEAEAEADNTTINSKTTQKNKSVEMDNAILICNKAIKLVIANYEKKNKAEDAAILAEAWDAIKATLE